jgi:enoyl-CoA hydratase/carnithine racemase
VSLRVEQDGRVRRVKLVSPAARNMLNAALAGELLWELTSGASGEQTGAVLLEAEGDAFCAGTEQGAVLPEEFFLLGKRAEKPVVAAVHGVTFSAGVALLASAHIVIAAQGSSFGLTDLRQGHCDANVLAAVAGALGVRRTRELALTGRIFTTPEALAWGLVHAAVPAFELADRALAVARGLAAAKPEAVRALLEHFGAA